MRFFHRAPLLVALGAVLLLAGCASAPPPTAAMEQARAMLDSARTAQAAVFDPLDLGAAAARYAQAQQALAAKNYDQAARFAGEAEASAELARAKATLGRLKLRIAQQSRRNAELASRLLGTAGDAGRSPAPATSGGAP